LSSPGIARAIWDTPLYRDQFGIEYVRTWNRGYGFRLASPATTKPDSQFEIEVARPGESLTVIAPRPDSGRRIEPFAVLPDGQWIGAKIAPATLNESEPRGRAVVLGFYLSDIKGAEARQAVLKEALAFLQKRTAQTSRLIEASESRPARREETPTGASS